MTKQQQLDTAISQIAREAINDNFLRSYKDDIFVVDLGNLRNDTVAGDKWLWTLKSNGCGSYLTLCHSDNLSLIEGSTKPDDRHYLLSCSATNVGTVEKISHEKALDLASNIQPNPDRIPPRESVPDLLEKEGVVIRDTHAFNFLCKIRPGSTATLRIAPAVRYGSIGASHTVEFVIDTEKDGLISKSFSLASTDTWRTVSNSERASQAQCRSLKVGSFMHATIEDISEKLYEFSKQGPTRNLSVEDELSL
jgi:hypothetical protein